MKTWLFIWNPEYWAWDDILDGYSEVRNEVQSIGFSYIKWTCGVNKSIDTGDRVYLMRLGSEPKGIVASGFAASPVFEGAHWNKCSADKGKKARRVFIKLDKVLNCEVEILSYDELKEISSEFKWCAQCSGVSIPESIAVSLGNAWSNK